jgi:hypothetical protein
MNKPKSKFEKIGGDRGYVNLTREGEQLFENKCIKKYGIGFWKLKKKMKGGMFSDTVYIHDKKLTTYPVRITACKSQHYEGNKLIWNGKHFYAVEMVPFMGY